MTFLVRPKVQLVRWLAPAAAALGLLTLPGDGDTGRPEVPTIVYLGFAAQAQDQSFAQFQHALARQRGPSAYRLHHVAPAQGDSVNKSPVAAIDTVAAGRLIYVAPASRYALQARRDGAPWPVVFSTYWDPVAAGLVDSLAKPGGRLTGVSLHDDLDVKRLRLLHEAAPQVRRVAVLVDDDYDRRPQREAAMQAAARELGLGVHYHVANTVAQLDALMGSPAAAGYDAWYLPPTNIGYFARSAIVAHLRRLGAVSLFTEAQDVQAGGLMAYVQDASFAYDALASLTLRVLDGEDPGTIPIERPKRYLLVVRTGAGTERTPINPAVLRRADVVVGD